MNHITYQVTEGEDGFAITTARSNLPIHGRWIRLEFTTYCDAPRSLTAMSFGLEALKSTVELAPGVDSFQATDDGILRMQRGSGGHYQEFDQQIDVPSYHGRVLDWMNISDAAPVEIGREFSRVVMRKMESIVETLRQHIRRSIGGSTYNQTIRRISERYGLATESALATFLGDINWQLMLSGCDDRVYVVVNTSMQRQQWDRFGIDFAGESNIDPLSLTERTLSFRTVAEAFADAKATSLLRHVCGKELSEEFMEHRHITVYSNGYKFVIAPHSFVKCTDPDGKNAELCIHTAGFSCNPIDEVVIAYLHVRHKFDAYMEMAVVHCADHGFSKTKKG